MIRHIRWLAPLVLWVSFPLTVNAQDSLRIVPNLYGPGPFVLNSSNHPVIAYGDKLATCQDANCALSPYITNVAAPGALGASWPFLAFDSSAHPIVAFIGTNTSATKVRVIQCNDPLCDGRDETVTGIYTAYPDNKAFSMQLDASGNPIFIFESVTSISQRDLMLVRCTTPHCIGARNQRVLDTRTSFYANTAAFQESVLRLDANDFPVIARLDNSRLKLLHCNDQYCAGNDDSETTPLGTETIANSIAMELDSDGYPVISYQAGSAYPATYENYLLRCNDGDCSGGDEVLTLLDDSNLLRLENLQLDANGYPVLVGRQYADLYRGIAVLRCNDLYCSGGDESLHVPDIFGREFSGTPSPISFILDGSGFPIVNYRPGAGGGMGGDHILAGNTRMLRCTTETCGDARPVRVDIAPDDPLNLVDSMAPRTTVEVAIYGDDKFDATTVDDRYLAVGAMDPGATANRIEDIDDDGHQDYIFDFPVSRLAVSRCMPDNQQVIRARTDSGTALYGEDFVTDTAPCEIAFLVNHHLPRSEPNVHPDHDGSASSPGGINDIIYVSRISGAPEPIDPATLRLGRAQASPVSGFYTGPDGYTGIDFLTGDTDTRCWDVSLELTGIMTDGRPVVGYQDVWAECDTGCH